MYVKCKVIVKPENNNDKNKHKENVGGEWDKYNETSLAQTQKHEKIVIAVVQERTC